MADDLSASVGYGGTNNFGDVVLVQLLLNNHISFGTTLSKWGIKPLVADGSIGKWSHHDRTVVAITIFQREVLGISKPDGRIDRHGGTIRALKGSPKAPRKPKSTASDEDARYPGLEEKFKQFNREEKVKSALEEISKKVSLTTAQHAQVEAFLLGAMSSASNFQGNLSNIQTVVDIGLDVAAMVKYGFAGAPIGSGLSTASTVCWTVGQWLGFLGPFTQFAGFVVALDEAMSAGVRVYQATAIAYTVTAWVFEDPYPRQSQALLNRNKTWGYGATKEADLNLGWKNAQNDTKKMFRKMLHKAAASWQMSPDRAQQTMRLCMKSAGKTKLAQAMQKAIAAQYRKHGDENEATAIANHAATLLYPN